LISVGVGFHPELTGRENVYVNGTVLGLSKREIDSRFDQIVEFAELPGFIDTPVKFYSSGMFVRLGFSVAVAAAPDVLLVDEVLAVGDFSFQMRCFERMQQIRDEGTTIVVVSHNIGAIRGFCDRGVLMQRGQATFDGPVNAAISAYYESVGSSPESGEPSGGVAGAPRAVVESFELLDTSGRATLHVESGTTVTLRVTVRATDDLTRPFLGVVVTSESGVPVYSDTNLVNPFPDLPAGGRATYLIELDAALAGGSFTVTGGVHHHVGADRERVATYGPLSFYVAGRGLVHGIADLNGRFEERT
jgi:lipopolysaccharide transport system ATP-binding protein